MHGERPTRMRKLWRWRRGLPSLLPFRFLAASVGQRTDCETLINFINYKIFHHAFTKNMELKIALQKKHKQLRNFLMQGTTPRNDVLNKNRNKPNSPVSTVPKKDIIILLPYLGLESNQISKRLKSCIYNFYSFVNLRIIFQNTRRIKSFFPYKDRLNRSQQSKVIYKACCWDCDDFYIGKTKRRLHDRKTEHFKALAKTDNTKAVADHVKTTGHNIKWDHFETFSVGQN